MALDFVPTGTSKKRTKIMRPTQIINKKREYVELTGAIGESIGKLELGTKIFITGRSYSGKSTFIIALCKAIAEQGMRVDYNSHEEKGGDSSTIIEKMRHAGIIDEKFDAMLRFYKAPLESDTEETFGEILKRKASAGFAVLDSIQHAGMNKQKYIEFTEYFCNPKRKKIVAFISHWQKNDFVGHVRHDCDIKLEAMHYVVYVESRMAGANNRPIVLWEEGAKRGWGKRYKMVVEGKYWPGKK